MRKYTAIILTLALVLALCACGSSKSAAPAPTAAPESKTADIDALLVEDTDPEKAAEETGDAVDEALKFVDRPVSELIEKYGEPKTRDYSPSCLGDGEDGELQYDYFCVYTYKEGNQETVLDVR